jgi:hypothetical protein
MIQLQHSQEENIKLFFNSLHEKDKRRFASLQSEILGHGGKTYMSKLLSISTKTISRGVKEYNNISGEVDRIRNKGAGRKTFDKIYPDIDKIFLDVLKENTAGSPMDEKIRWTNLKQEEIALLIYKKHGVNISRTVIKQLLNKHNFRRRKLQKDLPLKEVADRDSQFKNINRIKGEFIQKGNPILSIDTKKKEMIGNFYRDGQLYCTETIYTFDHDFKNFAEGVIIPYGIYDYIKNTGYMYIGTSKDTSEFSCDNIKRWWEKYGKEEYRNSDSILILCDGGGSNSSRHYIFKDDLQKLSDSIGKEIRIAHYPPYTSKYNPIEHRLFSYISKAWSGVVFDSIETVKKLIEKTTTKKSLKVEAEIIEYKYETGRKTKADFKNNMKIKFDDFLPKWNYKVVPQNF